ncbi:MAG: phosphotransferase family protein [Streptosporangiaceae bacterium]
MDDEQVVTVGVDTHADAHVAAVLDQAGRLQGKFLADYGLAVIEVERPDSQPGATTASPTRLTRSPQPALCSPAGQAAPRSHGTESPPAHPSLRGPAARSADRSGVRDQGRAAIPGGSGEKISRVRSSESERALAAAMSIVSALGLPVDDAIVLHASNKLTVRLLPCDIVARVAPVAHQVAQFEIGLAQRLTGTQSPVAGPDPRADPRVYDRDGFVVTLWTYCKPARRGEVSPADYANALERLHAGMRKLDVRTPHFTDRVAEAQRLVESSNLTPDLASADRELLITALRSRRRAIAGRGAVEQLLHGEPHPGNVLSTQSGLLFIDFETCCRGPVEFDLAHVPEAVSERYAAADKDLLFECRGLVLAMVAAWRWDRTTSSRTSSEQLAHSSAPCDWVHRGRRSMP